MTEVTGTAQKRALTELRQNPVIPEEFVMFATARSMRPKKEVQPEPYDNRSHVADCPFCRGNEAMTPPPLAQVNDENGNWIVRSVSNKFPVLDHNCGNQNFSFGVQRVIDGFGCHEVMIDHPDHGIRINAMDTKHLALLFTAYRNRMETLYKENPQLKHVLVFKNFGEEAGGSIKHTHSQILAMPIVLKRVAEEMKGSQSYYREYGECIFCTQIDEARTLGVTVTDKDNGATRREIFAGQLVIERTKHFIAMKPFASRHEWEISIIPLVHTMDFLHATAEVIADLASLFKSTLSRLDAVVKGLQYNFLIHSANATLFPGHAKSYHWYIEIIPRTVKFSGIELGTGCHVNTIAPEDAAERLRTVNIGPS